MCGRFFLFSIYAVSPLSLENSMDFLAADDGGQCCRRWSTMLLTMVGNAADDGRNPNPPFCNRAISGLDCPISG